MSRYPLEPRNGLFPARIDSKLAKTLAHMDAQAVALERADELKIGRSVQATRKGMAGIARISAEEAAWVRAVPHAQARLRAAADGGSATVLGHIFEAGF